MEKLLSFDPMSRIDVQEALQHPYFELFHDPDDEVGQVHTHTGKKKKKNLFYFIYISLCMQLRWISLLSR